MFFSDVGGQDGHRGPMEALNRLLYEGGWAHSVRGKDAFGGYVTALWLVGFFPNVVGAKKQAKQDMGTRGVLVKENNEVVGYSSSYCSGRVLSLKLSTSLICGFSGGTRALRWQHVNSRGDTGEQPR